MNDLWSFQLPESLQLSESLELPEIRMVGTAGGGDGAQQIPSLFGNSVEIPASGESWTEQENQRLLQYKRYDWTWQRISEKLGGRRSDNACKAQYRRLKKMKTRRSAL